MIINKETKELSKLITLIESQRPEDLEQAFQILNSIESDQIPLIIGITGFPGAGKSSLIEKVGLSLVKQNYKVAVLPIDPRSELSGGSILGDKTRMEEFAKHQLAFVRPSPNWGSNSLSFKAPLVVHALEKSGFDYIFIETVGIGQAETTISHLADLLVSIVLPDQGDDLQAFKKGILELSNWILVNKADGERVEMAKHTVENLKNAHQDSKSQKIIREISTKNDDDIANILSEILRFPKSSQNREKNKKYWYNFYLKELFFDLVIKKLPSKLVNSEFSESTQSLSSVELAFKAVKKIEKNLMNKI